MGGGRIYRAGPGEQDLYTKTKRKRKVRTRNLTKKDVIQLIDSKLDEEVEKTYFDAVGSVVVNSDFNRNLISLCDIPEGDGDQEREGHEVKLDSIYINYLMHASGNTDGGSYVVRFMLIQWHNDDTPNISEILMPPGTSSNTLETLAPLNILKDKQFTVLHTHMYTMNNATSTELNCEKIYLTKGFRKSIEFVPGSQSAYNKIYLLVFSNAGNLSNDVNCAYSSRIRYRR